MIRIRTGGVPDLESTKSQTILEIKGNDKVREFLSPLKLFEPKKYAAPCDCTGDPTIEIYKQGRLVTAIAIKRSSSLSWPDNWPAEMLIESLDPIDHLNSEMAEKGFPKYKQDFEEMKQLADQIQKNRAAAAAGTSPIRRLMNYVRFDTTGWNLVVEEANKLTWQDDAMDQMVFIVAPKRPDQPDPRNLEQSRAAFRKALQPSGAGIVEVEPLVLDGIIAQWAIFKQSQQPRGFFYQTVVIIPTSQCDIVINMACNERGTTGVRESAVLMANALTKNKSAPNTSASFYEDPYDSRFDNGAVYEISDDKKWDTDYLNHPLSRTRRKMKLIVDSLKLSEEIRHIALHHDEGK